MTEENLFNVLSVGKVKKFQFKIKTNLSFEARIILKSYLKLQSRQFRYKIYTFQDASRQSTLKKATLPLVEMSFQSLPSAASFQTTFKP